MGTRGRASGSGRSTSCRAPSDRSSAPVLPIEDALSRWQRMSRSCERGGGSWRKFCVRAKARFLFLDCEFDGAFASIGSAAEVLSRHYDRVLRRRQDRLRTRAAIPSRLPRREVPLAHRMGEGSGVRATGRVGRGWGEVRADDSLRPQSNRGVFDVLTPHPGQRELLLSPRLRPQPVEGRGSTVRRPVPLVWLRLCRAGFIRGSTVVSSAAT